MKKILVTLAVLAALIGGSWLWVHHAYAAAPEPTKAEAPAFTVEQQAQIKTWNDRMVYLNQAKEKAVADLVSIVNEQSAIIRQYQALKPAKGAGKVDEKPTKGAGKGGEKK
jgi:hypothetical protein